MLGMLVCVSIQVLRCKQTHEFKFSLGYIVTVCIKSLGLEWWLKDWEHWLPFSKDLSTKL